MKRILFALLAIGVSILTFAGGKSDKDKLPYISVEEMMKVCSEQLEQTLPRVNEILDELNQLRKDTMVYKNEINTLKNKQHVVENMFMTKGCCKMLIEYPLSIPYDSTIVAQSLAIIEYFKIDKIKDKDIQSYCNPRIPFLKEYKVFNQEVYEILDDILIIYFDGSSSKKYPIGNFEKELNKTKYYKKAAKEGYEIKHLRKVIERVLEIEQAGKLSKEFLEDILSEMK